MNQIATLDTDAPKAQVMLWMLEGQRAEDIAEAIAAKFPGTNAAGLIQAATDHFYTVAEADTQVIKGWCLEVYRELYRRLVEAGDYKGAIAAVKELRKEC
jgi:hypothetical protein